MHTEQPKHVPIQFRGETLDASPYERSLELLVERIRIRIHQETSSTAHLHGAIGWEEYSEPIIVRTAEIAIERGILHTLMHASEPYTPGVDEAIDEIIHEVFMQPYRDAIEDFRSRRREDDF